MNQKNIGIILIALSLSVAAVVYSGHIREIQYVDHIIEETGSCYLTDGTCLHDQSNTSYTIGLAVSIAVLIAGIYLIIDKTPLKLAEHSLQVSNALEEVKKKDEFKAFLAGFTEEEQSILKAVKEQEGIKQSTLRYKTGISKSTLSIILKSLEERGYISRKKSGKTNEIYLKNTKF